MKLTVPELVTLILAHDMERTRVEELLQDFAHENYEKGKNFIQGCPSLTGNKELSQCNKITLIKLIREYAGNVLGRENMCQPGENPNGLAYAKSYVEKYFNLQ